MWWGSPRCLGRGRTRHQHSRHSGSPRPMAAVIRPAGARSAPYLAPTDRPTRHVGGRGRRARRPSSPRRAIGGSCPPGLARACGGNARSIPTAVRCRLAVACGVPRPDQPSSAAPTTMQSPAVVLRPDPRDHWPVSWAARASDAWHETGLHGRCDECNERSGRSMFGGQPL